MIIMSDLNGVFRSALVAVLTAGMLAYLARSARKYSDRKVGLTMAEQPNTTFDFPIVSVCAIVPEFKYLKNQIRNWEFGCELSILLNSGRRTTTRRGCCGHGTM